MISLIAALSVNQVIGKNNALPWRLPADHAHFWRTTQGHPFIMGRKSFLATDSLVSDARNIILTSQPELVPTDRANLETAAHLSEALQRLAGAEEIFVLGGGQVFKAALPLADRMYLSVVEAVVEGDAFFPEPNWSEWQLTTSTRYPPDAENALAFSVNIYDRVSIP